MTDGMESSSEKVLEVAKGLILAHYVTSERPYLLAQLGSDLRKAGVRPPPGPLLALLQPLLTDGIELVRSAVPSMAQAVAAVPAEKAGAIRDQLNRPSQSFRHPIEQLHRGILIAFCKSIDPGERMFVRTMTPVRYFVGQEAPDSSYVEVPSKYRIPGAFIPPPGDMVPAPLRSDLAERIAGWVAETGVKLEPLPPTPGPPAAVAAATALHRLIDAQPPALRGSMVLPLDVAELLLKHA